MPVWGLAKTSVRVFLNFSFGQFFSQPLSDDQVVVTAKGVGCKDIYFNIKKINAILAERGIPIVVCVAYIAELVISLPWSIELNGVDLVIQASPDGCHAAEDDALLNSMISSMTAAAFAAAKVADGSNDWFKTHTRDLSRSDEEENDKDEAVDESADSENESGKSSGLISRVQRFFERLTKTAEKVSSDGDKPDSIVDQNSKERVVYMIDSLIAQTSIVLRNVSLRVECQLGLPGLNRASGITLCFQYLSLTNQSSAGQTSAVSQRYEGESHGSKDAHAKPGTLSSRSCSQTDVSQSSSNDGWSWLWPWGQSRKKSVTQNNPLSRSQPAASAGSLSTMLHKIIRLERADVLWDLWDSSPRRAGGSKRRAPIPSDEGADRSSCSEAETEVSFKAIPASAEDETPISGPTEENMVASAKLLSFPGNEHTARVSMRCPLFALATQTTSSNSTTACREPSTDRSGAGTIRNSTTPSDTCWSSFELRVHLDLGPVVACACPSQFYWLQLMVGQLSRIWQAYQDIALTQQTTLRSELCNNDLRGALMERNANTLDTVDSRRLFAPNQSSSHLVQSSRPYEECISRDPSESDLVDLDLSGPDGDPGATSRAFIDSKLFWSCVTEATEDTNGMDTSDAYQRHPVNNQSAPSELTSNADPKFSLAANVLCCALVVFYEDEPVSGCSDQIPSPDAHTSNASGASSFRRSMLRSTLYESAKAVPASHEELNTDDEGDGEEQVDDEPGETESRSSPLTSQSSTETADPPHCELAALPGPFYFFSRFHGLLPWRQSEPSGNEASGGMQRRSRSNTQLPRAPSGLSLRTGPMRIDRADVDTDQMTPSVWVSHLRRQFAELAYPRDHVCFVGGLWHVEFCTRSIVPSSTRGRCNGGTASGSSTDFDAQLFGLELSECLFCDPVDSNSVELDPCIHDILTFPDRPRGSSDRLGRTGSYTTAIKLSGMIKNTVSHKPNRRDRVQQDYDGAWSMPNWDTTFKRSSTLTGLVELACCRLDVDISLTDRLHRITDAIAAAREAVNKFATWGMQDSSRSSPEWRGSMFPDDLDVPETRFRPKRQPLSSLNPVTATGVELDCNGNSASNSTDLKAVCVGCEIILRFPVPLEAIKLDPSQQLSDLRKKLWSSGTPLWFSPVDGLLDQTDRPSLGKTIGSGALGLAWWRRCLRPEHLRICIDKLALVCRVGARPPGDWIPDAMFGHNIQDSSRPNPHSSFPFGPIETEENEPSAMESDTDLKIQVSLRSFFIHWFNGRSKVQPAPLIHLSASGHAPSEMITVLVRIASPGRTDLVEEPSNRRAPMDDLPVHQPVYTYSQQRFEMGVDLANTNVNSDTLTSPVEWSLWKRAGPKQDLRTPFVIRRNFIQDAPKAHSKQTTYYPGDANHLTAYRQSASLHTWLLVRCKVPVALVQVENKRTMELTYMRLMYDLLLWNSLLPSDRRLRATLTRRTHVTHEHVPDKSRNYDHCYWFLSDPAPLASIYAHPEAAREAAAREADSSTGLHQTCGLHFHPLYSDDEDDDDEGGDTFDEFDAGLDAIHEGVRLRSSSPERRAKNPRNRNRPRANSSESEEDGPPGEGVTTIQRQSQCTIQLEVGTLDARITLPSPINIPVGSATRDVVRVVGSEMIAFAELGHDGTPNVNFLTTEMNKLEVFFSPCSGDAGPSDDTLESVSPMWPCLLRVSWQSIGYPPTQTFGSGTSELGTHTSCGPMFTLAVEHRQTHRPHPVSGAPVYRDDLNLAVRLRDACLVHWPNLESSTDCVPPPSAMPNWLTRLLHILETPSVTMVTDTWPGYQLTDALLIQHVHLERLLFTWSTPDLDHGLTNPCSHTLPSLRSIRALIACESIRLAVNSASEAPLCPGSDGTGSVAMGTTCGPTVTAAPGMLIMSFISNAAVFLYPILRTSPPGLEHLPSVAGSCSTTSTPAGFLKWLKSFKMSDCVCVADLDHVELRCFADPMRIPSSNPSIPSSFITRIDIRSTNNLLRLHTCADSLAALQNLLQVLTAPVGTSTASPSKSGHEASATAPPMTIPVVTSADAPVSRTTTMANSPTGSGSRSSLLSSSPRRFKSGTSVGTFLASGSGSSVEDLLQDALSDFVSPKTSPYRQPEACDRSPSRHVSDKATTSHRSPEARPCRTKRSDMNPPVMAELYPRLDSELSTPTTNLPSRTRSQPSQSESCSPDSSPTEIVVIEPSMVPLKPAAQFGAKEQIRCLVPSAPSMTIAGASAADTGVPACGFELCENYYPTPSASALAGTRNRMHRLFTDPPSVYPRASLALTLYNFSMEWNVYGGLDLIPPSFSGGAGEQFRASPSTSKTPTPEHKLARTSNTSVGAGETRVHAAKGGNEVISRASKIAGSTAAGSLRPGVRFRHDRSVSAMHNQSPVHNKQVANSQTGTLNANSNTVRNSDTLNMVPSIQELYTRGGRYRDGTKCISLRLNKLYFRHAAFPQRIVASKPASESSLASSHRPLAGDPASRYVLNIGSLVIVDRVASSRINQLLYTFTAQPVTPGSVVPHNTDTPLLRAAIVCWRVPHEHDCSDGLAPPSRGPDTMSDCPMVNDSVSAGLELEAKISVQPLQINVDQNTLLFIEEFQTLFTHFTNTTTDSGEAQTTTTTHAPHSTMSDRTYSTASTTSADCMVSEPTAEAQCSTLRSSPCASVPMSHDDALVPDNNPNTERPGVFIRKVTFFPDLPIRLNYHGRHLDLASGSIQGFVRMLLQLNNGQLVIPRRVYQRGYPNLERLLEEVMADLRVTVTSQLPQLIATSIGPMHEVRLFLMGLWDLIYQPVHGVYRGTRDTNRLRDAQRAQWPATEWDLSTCDLQGSGSNYGSGGVGSGFIHGLRRGTRSFSTSTLWATLQLSIQSVRVVQSIAETAYDLVTPGPALRSRQLRLRQPADLREGFGNAMNAMSRGFQMVTEDLCGATRLQSEIDVGYKGPVGMVGDVLRQIPPTIVTPVVAGCEMAANILGGFRNQLRPEAKIEDEQKWKDTHGL